MDLKIARRTKTAANNSDDSPHLPEDLIFLILTRLPIKYVLRFRSVSKLWKSLISNPRFTRDHQFIASRRNPAIFLVAFPVDFRRSHTLVWIAVDRYAKSVRVDRNVYDRSSIREFCCAPYIVGDACDGVFCVWYRRKAALWNPATREVMGVEFEYSGSVKLDFNLASCVGFGSVKDERCNVVDFKLVLTVDNHDVGTGDPIVHYFVYSLRTNVLSLVEFSSYSNYPLQTICQTGSVCLNGVLHWLVKKMRHEGVEISYILTFDLVSETFGQIELPHTDEIVIMDRNRNFLTVVDNQYLLFGMFLQACQCLNMWTLREIDGQRSWVQHEKISSLGKLNLMLIYCDRIGGVITQEDLDGRVCYNVDGNGRVYDTGLYGLTKWFEYSESLVSLKRIINGQQESEG